MMKIKRVEYFTAANIYEVEINEALVKEVNEFLKEWYEPIKDITEEDIESFYRNDNEPSRYYEIIKRVDASIHGTDYLGAIVREYLSDALWDNFVESENAETDDYEDFLEV